MNKQEVYEMWLRFTLDAEKRGDIREAEYCLERISMFGLMA